MTLPHAPSQLTLALRSSMQSSPILLIQWHTCPSVWVHSDFILMSYYFNKVCYMLYIYIYIHTERERLTHSPIYYYLGLYLLMYSPQTQQALERWLYWSNLENPFDCLINVQNQTPESTTALPLGFDNTLFTFPLLPLALYFFSHPLIHFFTPLISSLN